MHTLHPCPWSAYTWSIYTKCQDSVNSQSKRFGDLTFKPVRKSKLKRTFRRVQRSIARQKQKRVELDQITDRMINYDSALMRVNEDYLYPRYAERIRFKQLSVEIYAAYRDSLRDPSTIYIK